MRTKKSGLEEIKKLKAIEDNALHLMAYRFASSFANLSGIVDVDRLGNILYTGSYNGIASIIDKDKIASVFEKNQILFEDTAEKAGDVSAKSVAIITGIPFEFSAETPEMRKMFNDAIAKRITLISESTEKVLRMQIQNAFDTGTNSRELAKTIADNIGMTQQQSTSYLKYKAALIESDSKNIDDKLAIYSHNAIKTRAQTIARTELSVATNKAQWISWQQAYINGLIPSGTQKVWCATLDSVTTEICRALDGTKAQWNGFFPGGYDSPPAHVNCRSGVFLDI